MTREQREREARREQYVEYCEVRQRPPAESRAGMSHEESCATMTV
jgi:hypothetical protein